MLSFFASRVAGRLSRGIGLLADFPVPAPVLKPVITAYSMGLGVDRRDIREPDGGFASFGDFFARHLVDGARDVCSDTGALVSPSDGKLVAYGVFDPEETRFSIKGSRYNIDALLGRDDVAADYGVDGGYLVVYLHPRDYHRVHVAMDGKLMSVSHIPGSRYPVAPWSESRVEGIYGKNERVVFEFETSRGRLALVMVAAFGVGHVDTPYAPAMADSVVSNRVFETPVEFSRGDDLGAFRLGSTVVLVWSKDVVRLDRDLDMGAVRQGRRLGIVG